MKDFVRDSGEIVIVYDPQSKRKDRDGEEIARRALSRVDNHDSYSIWSNNCEHFATWCVSGEHTSTQVRDFFCGITLYNTVVENLCSVGSVVGSVSSIGSIVESVSSIVSSATGSKSESLPFERKIRRYKCKSQRNLDPVADKDAPVTLSLFQKMSMISKKSREMVDILFS
jgi:hypothetical protein